jgi:hypothetical protein
MQALFRAPVAQALRTHSKPPIDGPSLRPLVVNYGSWCFYFPGLYRLYTSDFSRTGARYAKSPKLCGLKISIFWKSCSYQKDEACTQVRLYPSYQPNHNLFWVATRSILWSSLGHLVASTPPIYLPLRRIF